MTAAQARITPAPIRKTITVNADPRRAFEVFTAGMARWWIPGHHIAKKPFAEIVVEPKAGGRWFERDEDGGECAWGEVLVWEPPARLVLNWQVGADWQYQPDLVTEVEIRFTAEGAGATRVDLEHRNLERFGDNMTAMLDPLERGWGGLLQEFEKAV